MTVLILQSQTLGPFKTVETLDDRLRCDGTDYPFTVIGSYVISEDDSLAPPPPTPPVVVPESVTPRQFRQQLDLAGLYDTVQTAVSTADNQTKIWWEYATSIERSNGPLNAMATSLGVTPEQLDGLFIGAATL